MAIQIYAELLSNIRQISVAVTLPSPSDASTQATIAADCLRVKHNDDVCTLTLPGMTSFGMGRLPIPSQATTTLSWRLPLAPSGSRDRGGREAPWSATDLQAGEEIRCRNCSATLVPRGAVQVWKDLPSENWAEMMEFWHCHKPDHEHHHHGAANGEADESSLTARGYGANSAIQPQDGVGLVDLTAFLLLEKNCANLAYGQSTAPETQPARLADTVGSAESIPLRNLPVSCAVCAASLGYHNAEAKGLTLFKWKVSISGDQQPDVFECLGLTLLTMMARTGSSKALVIPTPEPGRDLTAQAGDKALHTWILNGDIQYSSSGAVARVIPAVKLLYRVIDRVEAEKLSESFVDGAPDISFPVSEISVVEAGLAQSNSLLPPNERSFKGWTVGLLTKWRDTA